MDKNIMKQYVSIIREINDEEKRIEDMQREIDQMQPENRAVADVVTKGRRGKKPLGTCKIQGNEDHKIINKKRTQLRERKAKKELHVTRLDLMVIEVEEYIYGLPKSEIRRILLLYCVDRKSWQEVAEAMGDGYTAEACKQKFSRFMRVK